ncbi:MAG: hypothetical protein WBB45_19900 [Cyclobacteriaceae bacterium]
MKLQYFTAYSIAPDQLYGGKKNEENNINQTSTDGGGEFIGPPIYTGEEEGSN